MTHETGNISLPPWALTSASEARRYLNIEDATDSDMLGRLILRATSAIERYCKRRLKSRRYQTGNPDTRLVVHGRGTERMMCPEYPLTTLTGAWYRMFTGSGTSETAINIAGARISPGSIIELFGDIFPCGVANILLDVTAGYLAGLHDADLAELEQACLRTIQVWWQDWRNQVGRGVTLTEGGQSIEMVQGLLPKDVEQSLMNYVRIG